MKGAMVRKMDRKSWLVDRSRVGRFRKGTAKNVRE